MLPQILRSSFKKKLYPCTGVHLKLDSEHYWEMYLSFHRCHFTCYYSVSKITAAWDQEVCSSNHTKGSKSAKLVTFALPGLLTCRTKVSTLASPQTCVLYWTLDTMPGTRKPNKSHKCNECMDVIHTESYKIIAYLATTKTNTF